MEKTIRFFLLCLFALTCSAMNAQGLLKVMQRILRFKVTPANEGVIVKVKTEDSADLLNHVSTTKQITVENGHALFVVMDNPQPIVGSLNVRTHPSGAQVYIDGKKTEYVTPCMIDNVLIGTHKIELKLDGVKSVEQKVTVRRNMSLTIEKTLCSKNQFAIASKNYMINDGDNSSINIDELKENQRIGGTVTTSKEPEVFDNAHVEAPASFPGGECALLQFVSNNFVYPENAQKQEVEGMVVVRFMVGTNGIVSDLVVEKSLTPECD